MVDFFVFLFVCLFVFCCCCCLQFPALFSSHFVDGRPSETFYEVYEFFYLFLSAPLSR